MDIISKINDYRKRHGALAFLNLAFFARKLMTYVSLHDDLRGVVSLKFNKSTYDNAHAVDTDAAEFPDDLTIDSDNRRFATFYQATPVKLFHNIMKSIPASLETFNFIDIGSGKGRVLLMASEWPFKTIVGYEFARELHEVALHNVAHFSSPEQKCFDITPLHGDALDIELPDDDLVIFMFNPFHEDLIARFVDRLLCSAGNKSRSMYVCYVNPVHADVFTASAAFATVKKHCAYTIFKFAG